MQSECFSSYGVMKEHEGCSPTISQLLQSTGLQSPVEWWSVTHSITAICLSIRLSPRLPSPSNLLLAYIFTHSFSPIYFPFTFISTLFFCSCSLVFWIFHHSHSFPSSLPVYHQSWISSLHLPLLFSPLVVTTISPLPCLHSRSPSVFLPFGRLGYLYIKPSLSRDHVELTQKYNVTMLEKRLYKQWKKHN